MSSDATDAGHTDTIAAVATAIGAAGIGIVRLSGPLAFSIAAELTGRNARKQPTHTLRRVNIREPDTKEPIDDALLAVFPAPRSLTGEDVVEIQGHGGAATLRRVLGACLRSGARAANPGEFTMRAFLNGKMDLAQAEAVADLVNAETRTAQRAARRQLSGDLSRAVAEIAAHLEHVLALIEASIDFVEEVGELPTEVVQNRLQIAQTLTKTLLRTAKFGTRVRDGVTIVLAGAPNVGKSSLLNALSGRERAIVTPVAGTTRDIVEDLLEIEGIPVRALDTAGLRETEDAVERIGVARTRDALETADVVVAVLDATRAISGDEREFLRTLSGRAIVVARNKSDVAVFEGDALDSSEMAFPQIAVSAVTGVGLGELRRAIFAQIVGENGEFPRNLAQNDAILVTNARHEAALRDANTALDHALATISNALPAELIAVDAHGALHALGQISGATTRDSIIAEIFARFCIGK